MAAISQAAFECVRTQSGGPPLVLGFQEAAAQVFKKGDILIFTAGRVSLAGAEPTGIVGVAMMDATGTTDATVLVWLASSDNIFVGNKGTIGGAVFSGTAVAQADVGSVFGVTRATTPTLKWAIDSSKTIPQATNASTSRVAIVNLDPRDAIADTGGRLQFTFLDAVGTTSLTFLRAFTGL